MRDLGARKGPDGPGGAGSPGGAGGPGRPTRPGRPPEPGDAADPAGLAAELRRVVRGEVGFDVTSRALVTMDASNYRRVPLGVVAPRDADDVAAVLAVCRERGVPVVARGGGTSIAGQATG
ncbi:FAD-binding oxidoreductase, partial [Streptomyces adustus]|uniref:FAD-binding oxidoreductase n=1 Tax=Streptomyces adustus TaxID=1609272 RepID=UPI003B75B741